MTAGIILGLTGAIGMGKTTAARLLRRLGVPVHDADRVVHGLLAPKGAGVGAVAAAFPGVLRPEAEGGGIDRAVLGRLVFADPQALRRLEAILHPLVRADRARFLRRYCREGRRIVALDVPLLHEAGEAQMTDAVLCVSAPALVQRQRVLKRPGMSEARLAAILARQLSDAQHRRLATWVIPSGQGVGVTLRALKAALRQAQTLSPKHWPPRPAPRWPKKRF